MIGSIQSEQFVDGTVTLPISANWDINWLLMAGNGVYDLIWGPEELEHES